MPIFFSSKTSQLDRLEDSSSSFDFNKMFDWFKSKGETPTQELRTWDPRTVTMQQPTIPAAPTTNQIVSEQPRQQETMHTSLRGGGEGEDVCCGVCTGIACFECCECCC